VTNALGTYIASSVFAISGPADNYHMTLTQPPNF
jgi:hypothetical protein